MQIDQTERHVIENRGARNTLIIRRVHLLDFGNYSCVAENQLGKSKQSVYLTGKPKAGSFRSAPISQWKDKYNISWIVDSHSTIEEYKLYYRLITADEEQQHNHNHHHMFHDGKNDLSVSRFSIFFLNFFATLSLEICFHFGIVYMRWCAPCIPFHSTCTFISTTNINLCGTNLRENIEGGYKKDKKCEIFLFICFFSSPLTT